MWEELHAGRARLTGYLSEQGYVSALNGRAGEVVEEGDGAEEYTVDLVETFFSNLDLVCGVTQVLLSFVFRGGPVWAWRRKISCVLG